MIVEGFTVFGGHFRQHGGHFRQLENGSRIFCNCGQLVLALVEG